MMLSKFITRIRQEHNTKNIAKTLPDTEIARMLGGNLQNIMLYRYYPTADGAKGWNCTSYANVELLPSVHCNIGTVKNILDAEPALQSRRLIISAFKTVSVLAWMLATRPKLMPLKRDETPLPPQGFVREPVYNASGYLMANVIWYNPATQSFEAHRDGWYAVQDFAGPISAVRYASDALYDMLNNRSYREQYLQSYIANQR